MPARRPFLLSVLFTLLLVLPACTSWRTAEAETPREVIQQPDRDWVRVTTVEGDQIEVIDPVISGDNVEGTVDCDRQCADPTMLTLDVSIPLEDIESVDVREVNTPLSALGVVVAAGLVAVMVWGYSIVY